MNNIVRQQLANILSAHGRSVADDPRKCEGLLRDYCGQYKREVHALVCAVKDRASADLQTSQISRSPDAQVSRLSQRLQDNFALSEEAAHWAIESWALALGVIEPAQLAKAPAPPARRGAPPHEATVTPADRNVRPAAQPGAPAARRPKTARKVLLLGGFLIVIGSGGAYFAKNIWPMREAVGAKVHCVNNLRQIGLAILTYDSANGHFPPAATGNGIEGQPPMSWRVAILPYLGEDLAQRLFQEYNANQPWDSSHNQALEVRCPSVYQCPGEPLGKRESGETSYVRIVGEGTVGGAANEAMQARDRDMAGGNNMILVVETQHLNIHWLEPRDMTPQQFLDQVAEDAARQQGAHHSDGFHALLADGRVEFIPYTTDSETLRQRLVSRFHPMPSPEPIVTPPHMAKPPSPPTPSVTRFDDDGLIDPDHPSVTPLNPPKDLMPALPSLVPPAGTFRNAEGDTFRNAVRLDELEPPNQRLLNQDPPGAMPPSPSKGSGSP